MVLLVPLRRSRTRRRTGQPTRCVRTMPPRSPDAARNGGRARSESAQRAERSPDGRSPPVSTDAVRASLLSWRGDFRRRCRERALPSSIALGSTRKIPSLARRTRPHRASPRRAELDNRGAFLTDDRSVGRARPEVGAEAPWCVRAALLSLGCDDSPTVDEVPLQFRAQRSPRMRSTSSRMSMSFRPARTPAWHC